MSPHMFTSLYPAGPDAILIKYAYQPLLFITEAQWPQDGSADVPSMGAIHVLQKTLG